MNKYTVRTLSGKLVASFDDMFSAIAYCRNKTNQQYDCHVERYSTRMLIFTSDAEGLPIFTISALSTFSELTKRYIW